MIDLTMNVKGREMEKLKKLCDEFRRCFYNPNLSPSQIKKLSMTLSKISLSSGSLAYALDKVSDIMLDVQGRLVENEDAEIADIFNGVGREIADTGRR